MVAMTDAPGAWQAIEVHRVRDGRRTAVADRAATEAPLEIRLHGQSFVLTMRTPGADPDLAAGFLLAEGVVGTPDEIASVAQADDHSAIDITLRGEALTRLDARLAARRNVTATSACGICGRQTADALAMTTPPCTASWTMPGRDVTQLPDRLRARQDVFAGTGGLHAAGLFSNDGMLLEIAEDVGRHNAVDKVIGRMLMRGALPLTEGALCVSGRASYELVQKALVAGIPMLVAVSAPSTMAIDAGHAPWPHAGRLRPRRRLQHLLARATGRVAAHAHLRPPQAEASPLPGHVPDRLGEPRSAALRLAHPPRRRVRWLRARHVRPEGLDAEGHAPLHGASRADAPEHRGSLGPDSAAGRGTPRLHDLGRPAGARAAARADAPSRRRTRLRGGELGHRTGPAGRRAAGGGSGPGRLLHDLARHHQRGVLRGTEGRPSARHQSRRQCCPPLPRGIDDCHEEDARPRRVHVQLQRLARRRPDRVLRIECRQQPAGDDQVPALRQAAWRPGRRRQHVSRAGAGAVLGAVHRLQRPVRDGHCRPLVRRPHRRRSGVSRRRAAGADRGWRHRRGVCPRLHDGLRRDAGAGPGHRLGDARTRQRRPAGAHRGLRAAADGSPQRRPGVVDGIDPARAWRADGGRADQRRAGTGAARCRQPGPGADPRPFGGAGRRRDGLRAERRGGHRRAVGAGLGFRGAFGTRLDDLGDDRSRRRGRRRSVLDRRRQLSRNPAR